jgi:hypothetical protein
VKPRSWTPRASSGASLDDGGRHDQFARWGLEVSRRCCRTSGPSTNRTAPPPRSCVRCVRIQNVDSASAEGNDAANWIVWRDANGDPIARYYLNSKTAHATAQLGEYLVASIALYPI